MHSILDQLGTELKVRVEQVRAAVDLLDGGATVPFIARYRKEATEDWTMFNCVNSKCASLT